MPLVHLGIDDTDSERGMCTTYLAALIVEETLKQGVTFKDYPNLIRLNPNIPWKTRGNAAVALRFHAENPRKVFETAKILLVKHSEAKAGMADPGIVMHVGEVPNDIKQFSRKALYTVLSRHQAEEIITDHSLENYSEGSGRGLIGALAAIGNTLSNDHTFELIAYRNAQHNGPREVVKESVINMDQRFSKYTFNSYDPDADRVLICPHGPDPVLCGIRGDDPVSLIEAFSSLRIDEPIERYMVFRSNQGTGEHLSEPLEKINAYASGFVRGKVSDKPEIQVGGHVFFHISDGKQRIKCACYEPAGDLRKVVLGLIVGDMVEVGGGVRKASRSHPSVLNIEYIKVVKLAEQKVRQNPVCPNCKIRMKSEGRGQGFSCPKCEARASTKVQKIIPRSIKEGPYLPPLHSQRHLTKPLKRYGRGKASKSELLENWFRIYNTEIVRIKEK